MRLEDELGGALVRREGKRTHLTPFGNAMVPQFRLIAETNEQAENAARDYLHGPDRTIKVAVMCTIGPRRVSQFLAYYHTVQKNTRVVLFDVPHSKLIDRLLDGHADCALVGAEVNDEQRVKNMHLYKEQLVVVHSKQHPFMSRESVLLDDVLAEPYLDRLSCEFRFLFIERCQERDFEPDVRVLSDSDAWIQTLIRDNVGVSIMPKESVVLDGLATTPLNDESEDMHRKVSLVVPTGREDTPDIRGFLQVAREYQWSIDNSASG